MPATLNLDGFTISLSARPRAGTPLPRPRIRISKPGVPGTDDTTLPMFVGARWRPVNREVEQISDALAAGEQVMMTCADLPNAIRAFVALLDCAAAAASEAAEPGA
jgi:hypothetical protein